MTPEITFTNGIEIEELYADNGLIYYHFMKTDKHLILTVDLNKRLAVTSIENIPEATREIGITTMLYQKALSIIRELANAHNTGIYYRFSTGDEKMKRWLRDPYKGMAVLDGAVIKNTPTGIEAVLEINP